MIKVLDSQLLASRPAAQAGYESAGQIAADEYGISHGQTWGAAPSHVQAY